MDDITPNKTEPETPDATSRGTTPSDVPLEPQTTESDDSSAPVAAPTESTSEEKHEESVVAASSPLASSVSKSPRGPMTMVIIIAVLVVLALGVVAYFAFIKKDTIKPSASKTAQTAVVATADPVIASQKIDSSLNKLNDTKDYDQANLNDTSLGL